MSTIEEWERHCAYCRQPITLKWKNGPMPSEAVCLVVDQVFHNKCWDKFWADHNGKRGSHLSSPASTSTLTFRANPSMRAAVLTDEREKARDR